MCLLVVLAGCGGTAGPADDGTTAATASATTAATSTAESPDTTTSEAPSESVDGGENAGWIDLGVPGRYVFEFEMSLYNESITDTLVLETTEVRNGQATVEIQTRVTDDQPDGSGDPRSFVVTGPVEEIRSRVITEGPLTARLVLGSIRAGNLGLTDRLGEGLTVGERSTETVDGNLSVVTVTGTASYAGIDCHVVESRLDGNLVSKMCTRVDLKDVPYAVGYDESGEMTFRVELVEFERA
ncbi:hypothetical protein ACFQE1_06535 [Halobium palmae]|uniref:Lipid/polyisoprenoid-binding YceI-like domain-containing protein n=1 Tax=Halobium palmae TaxID=1776492 RepID=A0ABD5RXN8_9EURY